MKNNKDYQKSSWCVRTFFILFWTRPTDLWCNMIQTLLRKAEQMNSNLYVIFKIFPKDFTWIIYKPFRSSHWRCSMKKLFLKVH